jgi:hypothetical protein
MANGTEIESSELSIESANFSIKLIQIESICTGKIVVYLHFRLYLQFQFQFPSCLFIHSDCCSLHFPSVYAHRKSILQAVKSPFDFRCVKFEGKLSSQLLKGLISLSSYS